MYKFKKIEALLTPISKLFETILPCEINFNGAKLTKLIFLL